MKTLRLYLVFLLVSLTSVAFAVTLPSQSFFGANELYADNEDNIEMSVGTKISNINLQILTVNSGWGTECLKKGEQGACQDCCKESLLATQQFDGGYDSSSLIYYATCIKECGGGPSLPLGSTLWLLPFVLAYGIVKRYKNKKADC